MSEHTDTERMDLIERVLIESPVRKNPLKMVSYREICFRVPDDRTLRDSLDRQLDGAAEAV